MGTSNTPEAVTGAAPDDAGDDVVTARYDELDRVARQTALRRLTVSGGHEVDDVVAQAFEEYVVYAATHTVENPGALIRVIARRRAAKQRDQWEARRDHDWIDDSEQDAAAIPRAGHGINPADTTDPLSVIIAEADRDALAWAIGELDAVDQQITQLTYYEQLTSDQVGAALGLAAKTVRNRLVDIRRRLALLLTDD